MGNVRFSFLFSFEKINIFISFSIVQEIKKHRSDVKKISAKLKNRELRVAQLEENQLESNNLLVLTTPADNNPPTRGGKSKQTNKGGGRGVKGAADVIDTAVKTKKGKGGGREGADNGEERAGKGGGGGGKEKREKGEKEKTTNREKGEKEKSGSRGKTLTFIKQNSRSW